MMLDIGDYWICSCGVWFKAVTWGEHSQKNRSHVLVQWSRLPVDKRVDVVIELFNSLSKPFDYSNLPLKYGMFGFYERNDVLKIIELLETIRGY